MKSIEEDVLHWFSYVERMENDKIAKRDYLRECVRSHSTGQLRKEEFDWYCEGMFKKGEVWMSDKQGEWCMIGMNGRGLKNA